MIVCIISSRAYLEVKKERMVDEGASQMPRSVAVSEWKEM